jgi:phosphopantothenoylcysteine decarboxylase/phosphopantothenate--cysteine ligase
MRIIVTAGPTREHIDSVRFITNASSGQMGCAVAAAAARAGHDVTLLLGEGAGVRISREDLAKITIVPFVSVQDLKSALERRFDDCDALVMAAAVGDFRPEKPLPFKLRRRSGPITIKLYPTEDILAGLGQRKREGQIIVAFAVEDAPADQIETKAREEMIDKNADYVVVNTPAAMAADHSHACILSRESVVLPWADRPKQALAAEIVALLT